MKSPQGEATGRFTPAGIVKITLLGFATSALWSSLHAVILPVRLLDLVSEAEKNTMLGLITFSGLIIAMLTQPVAGYFSDRTTLLWGRRRPYIFLGMTFASLILFGIALSSNYMALFLTYCLLQVSSNTTQGPYQAFIPELVAEGERGRASAVKGILEILGGVALLYPVAIFMDKYAASKDVFFLYLGLLTLDLFLISVMVATIILVRESHSPVRLVSFKPEITFKTHFERNRAFILFLVSRLLFFLTFTSLQTFALYFLRDVTGVASPAKATAHFSIVAVAGMLLAVYPAGNLSDRLGRRPLGGISGLIGGVGILLILLFAQQYIVVMFSGGLIGISFGIFISSNWALATDLVPKGEEARYLGLANLATTGGGALARLLGLVIDFFNRLAPNSGYSVLLIICFVCLAGGTLLLMKRK